MLEGGSVCPKDTFEEGIMPGARLVFPGSLDRNGMGTSMTPIS